MSIFSRLFERKNNLTVSSDIKKKDARSRNIAFVDTEVGLKDHKIHDIGALRYDGATFHQASQTALNKFLQEGKVDYICGHNLIHHDARYLQLNGILIDTLYLSPLLFPKRPYHHLVKDDKLMSEQMNNPVNDCEKAKELLMDEIAAWNQLSERKRKIFTLLLQHEEEFRGFLMYVGAIEKDDAIIEVSEFILSEYKNHICAHADIPALAAKSPCGLAYALALIGTDDYQSVTPGWVLCHYPEVEHIIYILCHTQCTDGCEYCNRMLDIHHNLKQLFGYDAFRTYDGEPLQEQASQAAVDGKSLLAIFPTGGGKSICFQLPAIYMPGTAIVVSPLIALMKDQVEGLIANGIPAATLNSMMPEEERHRVRQLCIQGKVKLLYISPEGIISELHWLLPRIDISLIAIDEAHCISHWGHDFRPEYTQLSVLKENFPKVPIIALTATADKITRTDILNQLKLRDPKTFISSFDRPNLSLTIRRGLSKKEKIAAIVHFINRHHRQSGIIYCMSRNSTESLVEELSEYSIRAVAYHAGLSSDKREKAQDDFINDRVNVVCATVAFGMGIDKSNVRWVIHYNMPASIENYYQEIGRAGRDGMKSDTLLFYSVGDILLLRRFAEESGQKDVCLQKLNRMRRYCEADICRRRILLSYFGEETDKDCGNCDVCKNPPQRFDGSILVQKALSGIFRTGQTANMHLLIDILRGAEKDELKEKGYDKLKTYGVGKDLSYKEWKEYLYQMLQLGYIEIDYMSAGHLKVTPLGRKVLFGEQQALMTIYQKIKDFALPTKKGGYKYRPIRPIESTSVDETLLDSLQQLRKQIAEREHTPAYILFSDDALEDMVRKKPVTLDEFSEIRGVGQLKLDKYGKVFVALIRFVLRLPKKE